MNKVLFVGRLTKNPEIRYSQGVTPIAIARCGLAVNRRMAKQGEQTVDFFNLVAFGKKAEFFEKYGSKGRLVSIEGRLQQNSWESQDKVKHTSYDVIIEEVNFLDKQGAAEQGAGAPPEEAPESQGRIPFSNEEDDLPF